MTTAEMLASVEAEIRKDIPRLMKLQVGCILQNEWSKDFFKIYDKTENHIRIFQLNSDIPNEQVISEKHISTYIPLVIIGHDITLNDVLEWIKKRQFFIDDLCVDTDGYLSLLDVVNGKFKCLKINWNLSSPYLKDQPEETIKFLYDLKQKIDE